MIEMGFRAHILQAILAGEKTVEGRLRTPKFVTLRIGDEIRFREDTWHNDRLVESKPDVARAVITETRFFDTFEDMFANTNFKDASPGAKKASNVVASYKRFYSDEQESEHGVVAIRFKVIT